jgi:uncharacterized protein YndB with AHSA1/START domain
MTDQQVKELTLQRTFDAPRDMVWKYWTDQQLVAQWWGPRGFTNPTCEWEVIPDGKIHIVMLAGDELGSLAGLEAPMTGKFDAVEVPEKLVFTASAIVNGKEVLETQTTVIFVEHDGKTTLKVHIVVTKTTPEAEGPLAGMEAGWNQQLDKLAESLKG